MDILEINEEKKYVRCEPLVTVQRLVEALKPKGKSSFFLNSFWQTVSSTGWLLSNEPPSDKSVQFSGFFNYPSLFSAKLKQTGKPNLC